MGPDLAAPFDGNPATFGNGVMIALAAASTDQVERVYAKVIDLGATSEGPAGPRGTHGFYAGYFRDPRRQQAQHFLHRPPLDCSTERVGGAGCQQPTMVPRPGTGVRL